ncbi:cylicin-1 [Lucilia sericata]|uniref:cylicin-1 n=1 Tax=Lucilia sericata TaxID=13632 RepID=UPI0018A813E5|nr:cylicin-1 [Lucilia sericata]XP_037819015.1 cylicin-1 [Lucilia sericata]
MSAKTSTQPGRRTPLSLSGTVTKPHQNKGGSNAAGNNANCHTSSNTNKQDNKLQHTKSEQQQQTVNNADTKENPNKKQQQADKKQQQLNENNKKSNEKNQNGVNSNKQQANESKQQQNKDKQQNGNENKLNEKEKKEKAEKLNKPDKLEKQQDKVEKIEKVDTKIKENKVEEDKKQEQEKSDNKREEKQPKEVKEDKEDKKEAVAEINEKVEPQQIKYDDKKSKDENQVKNADQKPKEIVENMEVVDEQTPSQQKSPPVTPKTNTKANKTSTPVNKTPTKATEKTPQKSTPSKNSVKTTPITKREVTTTIDDNDDIEMEPLAIESSPVKSLETQDVAHINIAPSATSTPGKALLPKRNTAAPKSEVQLAIQSGISPERPRAFSQISGRKSIRPISDYTPSKFQCNPQFRESYRRINTELDVTNTSMNVTVGSEVPNNLSFSFFGRGRKRDRTPPQHSQSAIGELQTDMEISPPKRARLDMHGFFSAVSSPLSLLRNRFSKATLQSSTPVKLQEKLNAAEDEIEVQNVSGVSVHEEIGKSDKETTETNTTVNDDNNATLGEEAKETKLKTGTETPTSAQGDSEGKEFTDVSLKTCGMEQSCEQSDIKITETPLQPVVGDPMAKNKRCIVM